MPPPSGGCSNQSFIRHNSRSFGGIGKTRAVNSAEGVMRALCSALGRVLPIALASLPGALVLHLDSVARILQVTAFQGGHYLWRYHVGTCPEYPEDLNPPYTAMKHREKRCAGESSSTPDGVVRVYSSFNLGFGGNYPGEKR
jgi:hypothetical protein